MWHSWPHRRHRTFDRIAITTLHNLVVLSFNGKQQKPSWVELSQYQWKRSITARFGHLFDTLVKTLDPSERCLQRWTAAAEQSKHRNNGSCPEVQNLMIVKGDWTNLMSGKVFILIAPRTWHNMRVITGTKSVLNV